MKRSTDAIELRHCYVGYAVQGFSLSLSKDFYVHYLFLFDAGAPHFASSIA